MAHPISLAVPLAFSLAVAAHASFALADASAASERPSLLPEAAIDSTDTSTTSGEHSASDLYFRISAGTGVVGFDMYPEAGYEDYSADGASVASELLLGISPYRGAALGGALFFDLAPSMQLMSSGADSTVGIGLVGPFIDALPEPNWGLHVGVSLGFAALSVHPAGVSRRQLYGLGGAAWAGKQFRLGKNWSMGGALRVLHTVTGDEGEEFDFEASCLATSLMLTAVHQ